MPIIMGILNATPDSFSDGGQFHQIDSALKHVEQMIVDGASIIDVGGESTRPGAATVSEQEEMSRVIPLLRAIKDQFKVKVSIDTSKANVMAEALSHGADMINDVRALQNEGAIEVIQQSDVPVCLMHMQGLPKNMQNNPKYTDVVAEIAQFFQQRIEVCEAYNITKDRLILDPGFGFGKTIAQNYQLLAHLSEFKTFGLDILAGMSRKSMIGNVLDAPVEQRVSGSIAAALIAAQQSADILRVHDVKETADALTIWKMTQQNK